LSAGHSQKLCSLHSQLDKRIVELLNFVGI